MREKNSVFLILLIAAFLFSSCGRAAEEEISTTTTSTTITTSTTTTTSTTMAPLAGKLILFLTVDDSFPSGESVYIDGDQAVKLTQTGTYTWMTTVDATGTFRYAYMRNNIGDFTAAEEFSPDAAPVTWKYTRVATVPAEGLVKNDTVTKWRWLPATTETLPSPPSSEVASTTWQSRGNGETFQSGVNLQDYWSTGFSELFDYTADHLLANNIKWIGISPPAVYSSTVEPVSINKYPGYGFTDSDLLSLIRAFRSKGINVHLDLQIEGLNPGSPSSSWWDSWFSAYGDYLNHYAQIAQAEGVSGLSFRGADNMLPGKIIGVADGKARWFNLLAGVRSRYSGKISCTLGMATGASWTGPVDYSYLKNIVSSLDAVALVVWGSLSGADSVTQSDLNTSLASILDRIIKPIWDNEGKPVVFTQIAYPSAEKCWQGEDRYPADTKSTSMWETYDPSVSMDLVSHAQIMEAYLKETANRPYVIGTYIFGYTYWKSIDKNYSIRSKPVEAIVSEWYRKANP